MTNEQESGGFKVVDRRVVKPGDEEAAAPAAGAETAGTGAAAEPKAEEHPASKDAEVQGPGWKMRTEEGKPTALPKVDFTTFCLSLASSAMMHLGLVPLPETGKTEKNLALAKQTIDILELLQEKTRGNLSEAESKLLSTVLYDLHMRFVESRS